MRSKERIMGKCTVEVFSRVTGFFRPIQEWNPGKKEEAKDRNKYDLKKENK
jgi:ribonucleoside-triphosphate reductase (formate)